jgi:hypothetical protein
MRLKGIVLQTGVGDSGSGGMAGPDRLRLLPVLTHEEAEDDVEETVVVGMRFVEDCWQFVVVLLLLLLPPPLLTSNTFELMEASVSGELRSSLFVIFLSS